MGLSTLDRPFVTWDYFYPIMKILESTCASIKKYLRLAPRNHESSGAVPGFALSQIWRDFNKNNGLLWAASLTYTTLFALVPLLAVALSLFKAFGGFEEIQEAFLLPIVSEILDPTHKIKVMEYIQGYVDKIDAGTLGIIGTLAFILTFIPLFIGMEKAINTIWARVDDRPIWLKFVMYWAIATLGPVAVVISMTTVSSFVKFVPALSLIQSLKPMIILFIIFGLFLIYKLVPNTDVGNKPALIGAITGGILWIIANFMYQTYMNYATASFSIYGSLGAIPVFLLWIYINWVIILLGAQVSRFAQYPQAGYPNGDTTPAELFGASLDILSKLFISINNGTYPNEAYLNKLVSYPPEIISTIVERLRSADIITIKGDLILPAKPKEGIRASHLLQIFMGDIKGEALEKIDISKLDELTLADLA